MKLTAAVTFVGWMCHTKKCQCQVRECRVSVDTDTSTSKWKKFYIAPSPRLFFSLYFCSYSRHLFFYTLFASYCVKYQIDPPYFRAISQQLKVYIFICTSVWMRCVLSRFSFFYFFCNSHFVRRWDIRRFCYWKVGC